MKFEARLAAWWTQEWDCSYDSLFSELNGLVCRRPGLRGLEAWPQGRARMMAGVYAQVVNVLVVAQVYRRLRSWISMAWYNTDWHSSLVFLVVSACSSSLVHMNSPISSIDICCCAHCSRLASWVWHCLCRLLCSNDDDLKCTCKEDRWRT